MSDMVERAAKAVYAGSPLYESGEAVDGFQVTPGGDMSWEHAIQLAAEFGGEYQAALDEHRALARAALLAALDPEDEELAWLAGKALYNSAADRAGRHRPDLDMRPFEQQSDDMQRAWKQDGAAVIAALKAAAQGGQKP